MEILRTNIEGLEKEKKLLYKLTRGQNMTANQLKEDDEKLDDVYEVRGYLLYGDVNRNGEAVELLSIITDKGIITAQSATIKETFFDMIDCLGEDADFSIKFETGKSKQGRVYIRCALVD